MSRTELREASIRVDTMDASYSCAGQSSAPPPVSQAAEGYEVLCKVAQLLPKVAPGMFVHSEDCLERLENEIDDEKADISSRWCSYNAIRKVP